MSNHQAQGRVWCGSEGIKVGSNEMKLWERSLAKELMLALNRNVGSMAGLLSRDVLARLMLCMIWLNLTNKRYKIPGCIGIYNWGVTAES